MSAEFINSLIQTVERVEGTARDAFGGLTGEQLNWRPGEGRWGIGECLNHLMKANEPYFAIFECVKDGTHQSTFWERLPLLPSVFGTLVLNSVKPETSRKTRAPKIFAPSLEPVSPEIVGAFCAQQRDLIAAIERLHGIDLDDMVVTSPVARFVTYSLRNALLIIVRHEERHLIQAQNVLRELNEINQTG